MHRFFLANLKGEEDLILQEKNLYHQIVNVFRAQVGDKYVFFDGKTLFDFVYQITSIEKSVLYFVYVEKIEKEQLSHPIHLFQALPNKHSKLEYIIQKGVEVGISSFSFFESERSQGLFLNDLKKERYYSIAIEAMEQSSGNELPRIGFYKKIDHSLIVGPCIFLHTDEVGNDFLLGDYKCKMGKKSSVSFLVGPEGGWSEQEVENFRNHAYKQIFLGNRVFRCETIAPIVGFFLNLN